MKQNVVTVLLIVSSYATVNRPPHIIQPSREIFFKSGETVEIPCIADGNPKPNYTWLFNRMNFNLRDMEERVVQLPNQGTLVFNRPEDRDEGMYQCFASNNYGTSVSIIVTLRQAKLGKFAPEPRKIYRSQAGLSLTLNCVPPESVPKADVSWILKEPDGQWTTINYDSRISMDFEGRLRITNVIPEDHRDGKAYICMVTNTFMRDSVFGPEIVVQVNGTSVKRIAAYEQWTVPSNQFFLVGQEMKIKCIFGGDPTPKVSWSKINGILPDRASVKSFGQELWISNVQLSDEGYYECEGNNSETTERPPTKSIFISVESAPIWVNEPVNAEVGSGESASFICIAKGVPHPEHTWYINGVRLNAVTDTRIFGNQHFQKSNNNITFMNLTPDYRMNIQCNVSNRHGSLFADVYLNVLGSGVIHGPTALPMPLLVIGSAVLMFIMTVAQ